VHKEKVCPDPTHWLIPDSDFLTVLQPMLDVIARYRSNQLSNYCVTIGDAP